MIVTSSSKFSYVWLQQMNKDLRARKQGQRKLRPLNSMSHSQWFDRFVYLNMRGVPCVRRTSEQTESCYVLTRVIIPTQATIRNQPLRIWILKFSYLRWFFVWQCLPITKATSGMLDFSLYYLKVYYKVQILHQTMTKIDVVNSIVALSLWSICTL